MEKLTKHQNIMFIHWTAVI